MIRIPDQVSWVVRRGERSWQGKHLGDLLVRLGDAEVGLPSILSVSLIFELNDHDAALRSDSA